MTREAFRRWVTDQKRPRWELVHGEPIEMAPERAAHNRIKGRLFLALRREILAAGLLCEVFTDGMTVEAGPDTDYEPDALIDCGPPIAPDATVAPSPVVIVEVTSPSTALNDHTYKLADYFRIPSVQHYLIVESRSVQVVHHARAGGGLIHTRVLDEGAIQLDPPGITISVGELYADRPAGD